MKIEEDTKLDFQDVLIKPQFSTFSSRADVSLELQYKFLYSGNKWNGIGVIAANMDSIGTFKMAKELACHDMLTAIHKHYPLSVWDEWKDWCKSNTHRFFVSIGTSSKDWEKFEHIEKTIGNVEFVCIDVANGYVENFYDRIAFVREKRPSLTIAAGNVATPEGVCAIIKAGADIAKIQIGAGSVCTTRTQTGVGYPSFSCVIECAKAARSLNAHIISDGGCCNPGDVAKAFGGGSHFVMLGGYFAGHDECSARSEMKEGQKKMQFYGMSSSLAMNKYSGGVADYRSSEGKVVDVPYKGPVKDSVLNLLGGIRSSCSYSNSHLSELHQNCSFIKINNGRTHNTLYGE